MQQKSGFKNLLLERKLSALADNLEKKEAQLNEVLSATNMDPMALGAVTRKLEVWFICYFVSSLQPPVDQMVRCAEPSGKSSLESVYKGAGTFKEYRAG